MHYYGDNLFVDLETPRAIINVRKVRLFVNLDVEICYSYKIEEYLLEPPVLSISILLVPAF